MELSYNLPEQVIQETKVETVISLGFSLGIPTALFLQYLTVHID